MPISDQTTVLSNLSLTGTASVQTLNTSALSVAAGAIAGALVWGSDLSSTNTVRGAKLKVGNASGTNAGIPLTRVSAGTFDVAAIACVANASTTTAATIAGLTTDDILFVMPTSSMSSGVILIGRSSGNSQATLIFSNASTAAQTIAAQTMAYFAVRIV